MPPSTQRETTPEDRQVRVQAPAVEASSVPSTTRTEPGTLGTASVALAASHVVAADPGPAAAATEPPSPGTARAGLEPPRSQEPPDSGRVAPGLAVPPTVAVGPGAAPTVAVGPGGYPVASPPALASGDTAAASSEAIPHRPVAVGPAGPAADGHNGCTAAQLRRFIKSRAYVPLHELRRRFELDGDEDDVNPIDLGGRRLFVGLPGREARLLGELLEAGDVGYELLLDPTSPLVVGVFPMRPVPRA